jgi:CDP-diacylglycerol--glycerol-3-phosphate 3-phosphatidyltransferase
MATTSKDTPQSTVYNLPNQISAARLVLALLLFVLLAFGQMAAGLIVFILAAGSDALDGYVARRLGQVTTLGRIFDPFVDKVVVLGAFIFLLPIEDSGLHPWMVTVIVARELLVTALRSFLERQGADFSASYSGKLKMVVQCVAIGWIMLYLSALAATDYAYWAAWARDVLNWLAVLVTIASGAVYLRRAFELL